jgi:tRNA(Ile)-lysidine synthase
MPLTLRHWRPGDRFQPLGYRRSSKIQNLLVNRKVPAEQRRGLVIGADASGEVFWIEGLPPGERFKVTADTTRVLTLKWHPHG